MVFLALAAAVAAGVASVSTSGSQMGGHRLQFTWMILYR
jgi:hypothetical protein